MSNEAPNDLRTPLENSTRSLHKVTFDPHTKVNPLPAVMEKLAYVKSLEVDRSELETLLKSPDLKEDKKKIISTVISVLKPILESKGYTESLKHSSRLANLEVNTLLKAGGMLAAFRKKEELKSSAAKIKNGSRFIKKKPTSNEVTDMTNLFELRMKRHRYGWMHLERIDMRPTSELQKGELLYSLSLAPNEKLTLLHKEWSSQSQELEKMVNEILESSEDNSVENKRDASMSSEVQSQISTAFSASAGSSGLLGISFSTNFTRSTNDSISEKRSQQQTQTLTRKSSAKARKEHKITFKTSHSSGIEDSSERILENKESDSVLQLDYYRQMRTWEVKLNRYGLRLAYDIVIPDPAKHIVDKYIALKKIDAKLSAPFNFPITPSDIENENRESANFYTKLGNAYGIALSAPPEGKTETIPYENGADNANLNPVVLTYNVPENHSVKKVSIQSQLFVGNGDRSNSNVIFTNPGLNAKFGIRDVRRYYINKYNSGNDTGTAFFLVYPEDSAFEEDYFSAFTTKGKLSIGFTWQLFDKISMAITIHTKVDDALIDQWRMESWQKMYNAARERHEQERQELEDLKAQILEEINADDSLTLRQREREEIMKRVMNYFFGYDFSLISSPDMPSECILPETVLPGEIISFLNQAIEWENIVYVLYPYFWSNRESRSYKMFLHHADRTHRDFLRAGAARVLITIRRGWENAFVNAVEHDPFSGLNSNPPLMPIAQELQLEAWKRFNDMPPDDPQVPSPTDEELKKEKEKSFDPWYEYMPTSGTMLRATKIPLRTGV